MEDRKTCCENNGSLVGDVGLGSTLVPTSPKKHHPVFIDVCENGFIIKIGCKTFVEKDWGEAGLKLKEYFDNPAEAEKKYCK